MVQKEYNRIKLILKKFISAYTRNRTLIQDFHNWLFNIRHRDEKKQAIHELMESSISFEPNPGKDANDSFNSVAKKLGFEENTRNKALPKPAFRSHRKIAYRVAAVLIPAAGMFGVIYYYSGTPATNETTTLAEVCLNVPEGETKHATLPDNSTVWVNSKSEITYNEDFSDGRCVNLKGEAYFAVAKEEERAFTVATQDVKVTVLGTVFSIVTNPEGNLTVISLYEGSLRVDTPNEHYIMCAGEELEYNAVNKKITVRDLLHKKPEWMRKIIDFEQQSTKEVLEAICKIYGYTIHNENATLTDDIITLRFEDEISFEDLLFIISEMNGFTYSISDNTVFIKN